MSKSLYTFIFSSYVGPILGGCERTTARSHPPKIGLTLINVTLSKYLSRIRVI